MIIMIGSQWVKIAYIWDVSTEKAHAACAVLF
jgi:hypothetical protein